MSADYNRLSEIADIVDSLHKTPKYTGIGKPMVRVTDVQYGLLKLDNTSRVTDDVFEEFSRRYKPSPGDIIITRVGSYGITALVHDVNFCLGQNTSAIIPQKINSRYLYATLNSKQVKRQIESFVVGSTQKTLSLKAINDIKIPRFSPESENRIANISSGLDDRIELNRQINQTLEEIAHTLFKSWFVDFEPVKAKIEAKAMGQDPERAAMCAISGKSDVELGQLSSSQLAQLRATASLFPDELIDSEQGLIPKGWERSSIYTICDVIYGAPFKSKLFNSENIGAPLIRIRDLKNEVPGVYTDEIHSKGYMVTPGDLLVGMDGEFRPYLWGGENAWLNQRVCCFKAKEQYSTAFLKFTISPQLAHIEATETATTVIHLGKGDIDCFHCILPPVALISIFNNLANSLFEEIVVLKGESTSLAQLRDTLLPKLLSGEIDLQQMAV